MGRRWRWVAGSSGGWRGVFVAFLAETIATSTSTLSRKMELKNLRIDMIRDGATQRLRRNGMYMTAEESPPKAKCPTSLAYIDSYLPSSYLCDSPPPLSVPRQVNNNFKESPSSPQSLTSCSFLFPLSIIFACWLAGPSLGTNREI